MPTVNWQRPTCRSNFTVCREASFVAVLVLWFESQRLVQIYEAVLSDSSVSDCGLCEAATVTGKQKQLVLFWCDPVCCRPGWPTVATSFCANKWTAWRCW